VKVDNYRVTVMVRVAFTRKGWYNYRIATGYRSCCCSFSRSCASYSTDTAVFPVGAWYWMYAI